VSLFVRHKIVGPLKPTANPYPSRIQRWKQGFGIIIFSLLLGGALRSYKPIYSAVHQSLFEGVAWIQGAFIRPFQEAHTLLKESHAFIHLKDEHDRLRQENEALKWKIQLLEPLVHENATLKQHLHVPVFDQYKLLTARVLSNPYDGLHHFFLIASGTRQGLEEGKAVVSPEGVVGRLEAVGAHVARVLLLNDLGSRIPVMTATSQQKAILAGERGSLPLLVYVEDIRKIEKGEKVVTSGLGGIFPPGLPVGVVEEIFNGKIRVRPYAPFQKLEWVQILSLNPPELLNEVKNALEGE